MSPELMEEYRRGLRELLLAKGQVVKIDEREREAEPHNPEYWVSPYGWHHYEATCHVRKPTAQELEWHGEEIHNRIHSCGLFIPAGVQVQEVFYSEFRGSFVDNERIVGINAYGGGPRSETQIRCNCGKYRGLTVRWEGSLQEALLEVLGLNRSTLTL